MDILKYNREAWNNQVKEKNGWTIPVTSIDINNAKNGDWEVVLTPTIPVPKKWFGDIRGKKILCLASGGGQQAPIFAAAGAEVTLLDNSTAQLDQDRTVAERDGLKIQIFQGDMRDLSIFEDERFDLIFHPVSNCFVDDVKIVWEECYRVLKQGGELLSGFCNPLLFLFDFLAEDTDEKIKIKYKIPYSDIEHLSKKELNKIKESKQPLAFGHTLDDQIGHQISAGFAITGFYEDVSDTDFLDEYIKTYIATKATKI